jgi:FKBP-type peptidyl-prolyl cis-trans isomerase
LKVPPELGYGAKAAVVGQAKVLIPPNTDLFYQVQLVEVRH